MKTLLTGKPIITDPGLVPEGGIVDVNPGAPDGRIVVAAGMGVSAGNPSMGDPGIEPKTGVGETSPGVSGMTEPRAVTTGLGVLSIGEPTRI
jgi:hypothetical protein